MLKSNSSAGWSLRLPGGSLSFSVDVIITSARFIRTCTIAKRVVQSLTKWDEMVVKSRRANGTTKNIAVETFRTGVSSLPDDKG